MMWIRNSLLVTPWGMSLLASCEAMGDHHPCNSSKQQQQVDQHQEASQNQYFG